MIVVNLTMQFLAGIPVVPLDRALVRTVHRERALDNRVTISTKLSNNP
jgi:hypothetical protein